MKEAGLLNVTKFKEKASRHLTNLFLRKSFKLCTLCYGSCTVLFMFRNTVPDCGWQETSSYEL